MHVAHAVLLAYTAIERLVRGMRMDIDQSGQDQAILAVDDPIRRSRKIPPNEDDSTAGKGDVGIAAVDVTPGSLVPADDPVGIPDDGRGQSGCHLSFPPEFGRCAGSPICSAWCATRRPHSLGATSCMKRANCRRFVRQGPEPECGDD